MQAFSDLAKEKPVVPTLLQLPCHIDGRGSLGVIEGADLPFDIRRIYYLYDVPMGAVRGEHGHKQLEQLILCMHGEVEIILNDGRRQFPFVLSNAGMGLYLPPGLWRRLRFLHPETVVCVLASRPYEKDDYIFEYEEFLAWTRSKDGKVIG
ncbi:sugar 3,4-ketoisomerase [Neotabrizicola sp. VNH66]|uniref:sugar 3,4-ketoisomerase n=1 Tax=Neotabrizicola sp. VNH66 TaxID=3400918 RepID=UPI003C062225